MHHSDTHAKEGNFVFTPISNGDGEVANIFIHGYSAGNNLTDRYELTRSIPTDIPGRVNIFAFWDSNHIAKFDSGTKAVAATLLRMNKLAAAGFFVFDRANNFLEARKRAEECGGTLIEEIDKYLTKNFPDVREINLIGHSLGGRLIVNALRKLAAKRDHKTLNVRDVLLMAAAVEVESAEAAAFVNRIDGSIYHAYSTDDSILHLNGMERSIGRREVPYFKSFHMAHPKGDDEARAKGFGHTDYWPNLRQVIRVTGIFDIPEIYQQERWSRASRGEYKPEHDDILYNILAASSGELLEAIACHLVLEVAPDEDLAAKITREIQLLGGSLVMNAVRNHGVPYVEILQDLGECFLGQGVVRKFSKAEELEAAISRKVILSVLGKDSNPHGHLCEEDTKAIMQAFVLSKRLTLKKMIELELSQDSDVSSSPDEKLVERPKSFNGWRPRIINSNVLRIPKSVRPSIFKLLPVVAMVAHARRQQDQKSE